MTEHGSGFNAYLKSRVEAINRRLGADLALETGDPYEPQADQDWIGRVVDEIAEAFLPYSEGHATLRSRLVNGWGQLEFIFSEAPFSPLEDATQTRLLIRIKREAESRGGRLNFTTTQVSGTVIAVTLPISAQQENKNQVA